MATMIRKISMKTVCGDLKAKVLAGLKDSSMKNGDVIPVMTTIGIIKAVKQGEHDQFGTYHEFKGQFEAIDLATNISYRAAKCFLPEVATDLLVAEYDKIAQDNDGDVGQGIQVALTVNIVVDESASTMYAYQVTPLIEAVEADPLAMLKAQAGVGKLEAPKADAKADKK